MITEDYVSFETAKLLKEKGFDCIVTRSFFEHDNCYAPCDPSEVPRKDAIAIPTHQMAMKWLRKEHNINLNISWNPSFKDYFVEIFKPTLLYSTTTYQSYEEACESAIKYCLNNLI